MTLRPLHFLIIAIPILVFGWLTWQELVPMGTFIAAWEPGQRSSFIDPLRPDQRVLPSVRTADGAAQAIVGDPVYTFLHPHRGFDTVSVDVWFQHGSAPIVEAGGLISTNGGEVFALQPLENTLIDESPWYRLEQDGVVLLQRHPKYQSLEDFYAHWPAGSRLAQYRFEGLVPEGTARLLPDVDLDKEGIDFVIARYQTPRRDGPWSVATLHLDPTLLLLQRGAWKIALSVPGTSAEHPVLIHRIEATMTRPAL